VLDKSLELLQGQQVSIMQQFGASAFYTVVHWHKQGEVDNECTLHISIVLAICRPKIIKCGGDLTKFWQKQVGSFFGTSCRWFMCPQTVTHLRGKPPVSDPYVSRTHDLLIVSPTAYRYATKPPSISSSTNPALHSGQDSSAKYPRTISPEQIYHDKISTNRIWYETRWLVL